MEIIATHIPCGYCPIAYINSWNECYCNNKFCYETEE